MSSGDTPRDKSLASETMAVNGNDCNDQTLKGDAPEKNIESIVFSMQKQMTENQKTMLTLTQTMQKMQEHVLCDPLKRGEKWKAQDIPQTASTSKTNGQDSESDTESDTDNDSFEELLVEGSEEKESDADDLLEELAEGFGSDDKCGEPIYETLAKVANDAWGLNFTTKKSRKFPRSTADQKTLLIWSRQKWTAKSGLT